MLNRHHLLILTLTLASGVPGLVGCDRDGDAMDSGDLGKQPLVEKPNATPPAVHFPRGLQTQDITLNKFIEDALHICAQGDYDRFRQLFASAYTPPNEADFERIWEGVESVGIVSVHADLEEPPTNYYVHAVVQLREPDARQRSRRDAILAVFKEGHEWRLSPASREVQHRILVVDSQPAVDGDPESMRRAASTSRPSTAPGV